MTFAIYEDGTFELLQNNNSLYYFVFSRYIRLTRARALEEETKRGSAYSANTRYTGATPHEKVAGTDAAVLICVRSYPIHKSIFVKARCVDLPRNFEHDKMRQKAEVDPETCA